MSEISGALIDFWGGESTVRWLRALVLLVVGILIGRIAGRAVSRILSDRVGSHVALLMRRAVVYTVVAVFVTMSLRELGFQLSVLLGAAGILTVAIGFASQTAASNLVSGLFLLGERPFAVGDIIRIGSTTGEVLSIDLLSARLRTFDNLLVRIPNETVIKAEVTNMSRFPIRRYDLQLGVAYKEDLANVQRILFEVADRNPLCLEEPKPLLIMQGFGDSSIDLQLSVWARRENYLALRNAIHFEIKQAFDAEGVEIPFPHRTLYKGSVTEAFPVRVLQGDRES